MFPVSCWIPLPFRHLQTILFVFLKILYLLCCLLTVIIQWPCILQKISFLVRDALINVGPLKDFSYGLRVNADPNATGNAKQSNYELVSSMTILTFYSFFTDGSMLIIYLY